LVEKEMCRLYLSFSDFEEWINCYENWEVISYRIEREKKSPHPLSKCCPRKDRHLSAHIPSVLPATLIGNGASSVAKAKRLLQLFYLMCIGGFPVPEADPSSISGALVRLLLGHFTLRYVLKNKGLTDIQNISRNLLFYCCEGLQNRSSTRILFFFRAEACLLLCRTIVLETGMKAYGEVDV
jgi:hypothetical protein